MQLLKDTTTVLLKDKDNKFVLYDFINDSNKQINLDNNKYTDFNLQEDFVLFTGTYTENGVEYEIRARLALDELMEMYEIQRADEAGTASPDTEGTL
jgi:hypothetical protein